MNRYSSHNSPNSRPITSRYVLMVDGRVVKIQTKHFSESVWVATGMVSEQVPTGPRLGRPAELNATGQTEDDAVKALRQKVAELSF